MKRIASDAFSQLRNATRFWHAAIQVIKASGNASLAIRFLYPDARRIPSASMASAGRNISATHFLCKHHLSWMHDSGSVAFLLTLVNLDQCALLCWHCIRELTSLAYVRTSMSVVTLLTTKRGSMKPIPFSEWLAQPRTQICKAVSKAIEEVFVIASSPPLSALAYRCFKERNLRSFCYITQDTSPNNGHERQSQQTASCRILE